MASLELNVEVRCDKCGAELEATAYLEQQMWNKTPLVVNVTPCDKCLDDEYVRGCEDGAKDPDAYQ